MLAAPPLGAPIDTSHDQAVGRWKVASRRKCVGEHLTVWRPVVRTHAGDHESKDPPLKWRATCKAAPKSGDVTMLFKPLPDPNDPNLKHFLWADETIVVCGRASRVSYRRHIAPLSLKLVRSGSEYYNVHGFPETVSPGEFLVTNAGQPYESSIDADTMVDSVSVFFSPGDVQDAARLRLSDAQLIDEPDAPSAPFEFPAVKRRASDALSQQAGAISTMRDAPRLAREEFSTRLLMTLIEHERACARVQEGIAALRAATRGELYRRCLIGHAYIDALFETDISLGDIAKAAGLSRAHFLRCFSACFGQSPYQALRQRRLQRAGELLRAGRGTVTEVALAVGYSNFSAFARAFKSVYGVSPSFFAQMPEALPMISGVSVSDAAENCAR